MSSFLLMPFLAVAISVEQDHNGRHDGHHVWSKISEVQNLDGETICQWKCSGLQGGFRGEHYVSTTRRGYCPTPRTVSKRNYLEEDMRGRNRGRDIRVR
ncbi:MAG: hypothetical protein AAF542_24750 [Pseudomonadota bacterium]